MHQVSIDSRHLSVKGHLAWPDDLTMPPMFAPREKGFDATVKDLPSTSRRQRLQANTKSLHQALMEVAKGNSSMELVSCPESFVQQLRCRQSDGAEERILELNRHLKKMSLHAQVCSPSQCGAEGSFDARLGARQAAVPSLRFCATSEHSSEDYARLKEALQSALR
eukprot:s1971_g20.t1